MPTYEVFLKKPGKDPFTHAGSLDAADDEVAAVLARECYSRRGEGLSMWLVERSHLVALEDQEFFSVALDKSYRFNDGSVVAERRRRAKQSRDEAAKEAGLEAVDKAAGPGG